jgi:hypothetical protein
MSLKRRRFHASVMEIDEHFLVSKGMYKCINERQVDFKSRSDYFRTLIMNDIKIDEYGNKSEK